MLNPVTATQRLGHIATRRQLMSRGFTGVELAAAVHAGGLKRVRRGWYASDEATPAQLTAVRVGGRLSHATAANSYKLWAGVDPHIHIGLMRGSSRLRSPELPPEFGAAAHPDVILHWTETGRADISSACVWRVPLHTCLRQVVGWCDEESAIACLETAISSRLVTENGIEEVFRSEPKEARLVAARARRGSESGPESICRQRFEASELSVRQQVVLPNIRRVDMIVGRRVIVEIDGRAYHTAEEAFERDHRQDACLVALGFVVLRFTYSQVMFEWPWVLHMVREALRTHG